MQWFLLAFCMIVFRHAVGLLWTSDQPVSETSTCTGQHNIETQQTNIHALTGIRTRDPSNQAAADLRLRPRGHRRRHVLGHPGVYNSSWVRSNSSGRSGRVGPPVSIHCSPQIPLKGHSVLLLGTCCFFKSCLS
jgi:hypothetical protein